MRPSGEGPVSRGEGGVAVRTVQPHTVVLGIVPTLGIVPVLGGPIPSDNRRRRRRLALGYVSGSGARGMWSAHDGVTGPHAADPSVAGAFGGCHGRSRCCGLGIGFGSAECRKPSKISFRLCSRFLGW